MKYLIASFLCLLPFAPFFIRGVSIWQAQGQFAQSGILVIFCGSLLFNKLKAKRNIPFALLILWIGIQLVFKNLEALSQGGYALQSFLHFFNFLCLVIFYQVCIQTLNKEDIRMILNWYKYCVLATVFYCVLQVFGVEQFTKMVPLGKSMNYTKNTLTGFLGHPTHLISYLAMCLPLFFAKRRQDILSLILIFILFGFIKSLKSTPISGVMISLGVISYYLFKKSRRVCIALWTFIFLIVSIYLVNKGIPEHPFTRLCLLTSGRLECWVELFTKYKIDFVTGNGLGYVRYVATKTGNIFKHLHNEYLQVLVELGLVGLILVVNCILNALKSKDGLLKCLFIGFLLSCLFTYPAHLWVVSTFAIFIYAGLHIGENNAEFSRD